MLSLGRSMLTLSHPPTVLVGEAMAEDASSSLSSSYKEIDDNEAVRFAKNFAPHENRCAPPLIYFLPPQINSVKLAQYQQKSGHDDDHNTENGNIDDNHNKKAADNDFDTDDDINDDDVDVDIDYSSNHENDLDDLEDLNYNNSYGSLGVYDKSDEDFRIQK